MCPYKVNIKSTHIMKKLVLALFLAFVSSNALALPLPSLHQDMPYGTARRKMLELGWQVPVINYECQSEDWFGDPAICQKYPEVKDCVPTGLGFCNFIFVDKNGNEFEIITAGQGEPSVVAWRNKPN
jgi:hypothetical protein